MTLLVLGCLAPGPRAVSADEASATPVAAGAESATVAPAGDLGARFRAIERPVVLGEIDPPPRLEVGRAEIEPTPEARLFVLGDGTRRMGLLLDGPVRLRYRVEDRFAAPVARRNLKRTTGLSVTAAGEGLVVSVTLRGAAVWGDDLVAADLPLRAAPGRGLPPWLTRTLDEKLGGNPALDLLVARANGEPGYRFALFDTTFETLGLDVDPRPLARAEWLWRYRRADPREREQKGRLYPEGLARQPIGRSWWEPTAIDWVSTETAIEIDNPRRERAEIVTRTRLVAQQDGQRIVHLAQVEELFDANFNARPLVLTAVTVDGLPAAHVRHSGSLLVELPAPLAKGQAVELATRAEGDVLLRPKGDGYWLLGTYAWYPRPAYGEERARFRFEVTAPAPFVPLAPGRELARSSEGGINRVETELAGSNQFLSVAAGTYGSMREEHEGLVVEVASYAFDKGEEARLVARNVLAIRICLENWLGVPYPFPDLRVLEVNDWGWGQAPAGMIFVTREQFLNAANSRVGSTVRRRARIVAPGAGARLAHEVAHGYFPHQLELHDPEDAWLSESFADYAAAVCIESTMADPEAGREAFIQQLVEWRKFTAFLGEGTSVALVQQLAGGDDDVQARRFLLYGKGPLVLHALRAELARRRGGTEAGDRLFFAWLRAVVLEADPLRNTTADVVARLERLTGEPWRPWFERYVYGTETPVVE